MTEIDPQEFGQLQARVEALRLSEERTAKALETMAKTLDEIRQQMAEARGGWKTLMAVGGMSGAIGAGLMKVAMWVSQVAPK